MRGQKAKVGDKRVSANGYLYTRTSTGWELTHRLVVENRLGRKLTAQERVKFKDNDRSNIDPQNLVVTTVVPNIQSRKAYLEDKIRELQAELLDLNKEMADD